jgi:molybdate transport system substrate-binding protein
MRSPLSVAAAAAAEILARRRAAGAHRAAALAAAGLALLGLGAAPRPLAAAEVRVAVAANFAAPLDEIGRAFEKATGNHLLVSAGSTGKLAAQIQNGAPFEVLLAADAERPAALEKDGTAVAGSRFTYARGRLVLWSADPALVDPAGKVLASGRFRHLAIANPALAPYGLAAQQALTALGLWQKLTPLLVQGEDIGQTFQFVASRAAELGFVALSQALAAGSSGQPKGSMWVVPEDLHQPIAQQAVLLAKGRGNPAAQALLDFLKGPETRGILVRLGYAAP